MTEYLATSQYFEQTENPASSVDILRVTVRQMTTIHKIFTLTYLTADSSR